MVAIRRCLAVYDRSMLVGSTLYTTGEPCAMCVGAILPLRPARVRGVGGAARDTDGSGHDLERGAPFAPIEITGGVLADEPMAPFSPCK